MPCPACGQPIASFHVEGTEGRTVIVVTHEDAVCELDLRERGRRGPP